MTNIVATRLAELQAAVAAKNAESVELRAQVADAHAQLDEFLAMHEEDAQKQRAISDQLARSARRAAQLQAQLSLARSDMAAPPDVLVKQLRETAAMFGDVDVDATGRGTAVVPLDVALDVVRALAAQLEAAERELTASEKALAHAHAELGWQHLTDAVDQAHDRLVKVQQASAHLEASLDAADRRRQQLLHAVDDVSPRAASPVRLTGGRGGAGGGGGGGAGAGAGARSGRGSSPRSGGTGYHSPRSHGSRHLSPRHALLGDAYDGYASPTEAN